MKKVWSAPVAVAEQFVADESVAACYQISCDYAENLIPGGNGEEGHNPTGIWWDDHTRKQTGSGCGWVENHSIQVRKSGDDLIYSIVENNVEVPGSNVDTLRCLIYPNATSNNGSYEVKNLVVGENVDIYWGTNIFGNTWMRHKGQMGLQDPSHPNRS